MKQTLTFYKNSNTGEIVIKQHFSEIPFSCPDYFMIGVTDQLIHQI